MSILAHKNVSFIDSSKHCQPRFIFIFHFPYIFNSMQMVLIRVYFILDGTLAICRESYFNSEFVTANLGTL